MVKQANINVDLATPLLSIRNVAEHCQVSTRTVRRWLNTGELTAYQLGVQWRISTKDLDTFLRLRRFG
jgi:excisionase family DNA binding protein